ncbi:MAG TPA: BolA family protein [Stenotrophobium sp.]|nr:BolA family protein [Stenotrophobium sp.]
MSREEKIRAALTAAFEPLRLEIIDDSHLHAGHTGAAGGHGHYRVRIVSARFAGQPLVARHRMVYSALGSLMDTDIHALGIRALTPEE